MLGCSQSLVARVEKGGEIDFVLFERWASILQGSLLRFATLSSSENLKHPWDGKTQRYRGRTIADWKYYCKHNKWPVIPGFYKFARHHYKETDQLFSAGQAIHFFNRRAALEQIHASEPQVIVPSPS
jgi:hypothetical protein